jgi:hypothetical protein
LSPCNEKISLPGVQAFMIAMRFYVTKQGPYLALCRGLAIEADLPLSCLDAFVSGPWHTTRAVFYEALLAIVFDLESHKPVQNLCGGYQRQVIINPARVEQESSELPHDDMIDFVGTIGKKSGKNHDKRVWRSVFF